MQNGIDQVSTQFFDFPAENLPFLLQNGDGLEQVRLAYETYGQLNSQGDNAILVFHALTGSQHAAGWNPSVEGVERFWNEECQTGWWDQFIGPGRALDTEQHFVICVNYLGGCYGSTGPPSQKPDGSGKLYAHLSSSDIFRHRQFSSGPNRPLGNSDLARCDRGINRRHDVFDLGHPLSGTGQKCDSNR